LPCPLTLAEQFFEAKAGLDPYQGSFLVHYLDRIVYPDLPESLLVLLGCIVCVINLLVYARRLWKWLSPTVSSGNTLSRT
jgi:hypothetical protein